jgi:hypothetical protein
MLVGSDRNMIAEAWENADLTAQLPGSIVSFMTKQGPVPVYHDEKRSFHRHYMRGKAILKRGDMTLGVYTKDVSRQGIGLLSPVQLLPLERVVLTLPNGSTQQLELARCHRVGKDCFDCGTRFVTTAS